MDEIKPTPRNKLLGLLADNLRSGLDFATNEGKNKPMNLLAEVLGLPAIQTTADRLSYGEPLTTGQGWTTRLKPDTFDAAISALPFVKPATKGAGLLAEGLRGLEGSKAVQSLSKASQMADRGAIVWHGSPHKFPPTQNNPLGEFDFTKIGTGEGAQAYGHGGYLGGAKETGEQYRRALAGKDNGIAGSIAADALKGSTPDAAISDLMAGMKGTTKENQLVTQEAIDLIKSGNANSGYLYKVDLPDEHIAKMLDWDKPLSQQAPHIRAAIEKTKSMLPPNAIDDLGGDLSLMYGKDVTPNQFLNTWESFGNKAGGENALQSLGIPGIKYLDGGSRAAGAGSSNYVVFPGNERLLKILERNGESAAPAFNYPQSEALKLAQQRAALPVSEGGLGLPANNAAMDRANVMFPESGFSGTGKKIDPKFNGETWITDSPAIADTYTNGAHPTVMPLRFNNGNQVVLDANGKNWADFTPETKILFPERYAPSKDDELLSELLGTKYEKKDVLHPSIDTNLGDLYGAIDLQKNTNNIVSLAKKNGYDSVAFKNILDRGPSGRFLSEETYLPANNVAVINQDNVRSRFAAFDPWRRNAAIAASMGVAAPDLLANPINDENNRLIDILRTK